MLKFFKSTPIVLFFFIALLTFLAYSRSLHAPLVLDDPTYITSSKLKDISHYLTLSFRSIAGISFALNYHFSGINLVMFRLTNIIFHITSAVLVFYLTYITLNLSSIRATYGKPENGKMPLYIALFAATLFSLHPIQTTTVNYITQRMALMAGMFSFAGAIAYVKGALTTGKKHMHYYFFSALFFLLAIFSKENAVMVLPALVLYDFVFISSFQWSEFRKRFIPLAVLGITIGLAVVYYLKAGSLTKEIMALFSNLGTPMTGSRWSGIGVNWTPFEYILTELRIVSRYIFLILVPLPSSMVFDYSNAYPVSKDLFHPFTTFTSLCFLTFILFFSLRYIRKFPLISFGILWYLITISLESFIAIGLDPYFEHRNYIPSYGLFLVFASFFVYADRPGIRVKKELIVLIAAILLSILTFTRNGVWRDGNLFWEDVIEKSPNNARAHLDLGIVYMSQGLTDKAIEQYQTALRLKPAFLKAYNNLGNAYMSQGLTDKAVEQYQTALHLKPEYAEAHNNLGNVYLSQGLTDKAVEQYQTALHLKPKYAEAYNNLGNAYLSQGLTDKAVEQYQTALHLKPDYIQAHNNLENALKPQNQSYKTTEQYRPPINRELQNAEAHLQTGNSFFKKERLDEAIKHYQLALKLKPDFITAHYNLGVAFSRQGSIDKALQEYHIVIKMNPKHAEAHENLGITYINKGLIDKAIEHFRIALALNPQNQSFRDNLAKAEQISTYQKGTEPSTRK